MNNYYIYVYLDTRKPGEYKYEDNLIFNFEPIYIGKGKNRRYLQHLTTYKKLINKSFFHKKLNNMINEGYEPIILKLKENLSQEESLKFEKYYIQLIGRIDDFKGTLTNLTDGGDGTCGYKMCEETKKKISDKNSGINNGMYGSSEWHPMKGKSFDEYFGIEKSNELKGQISIILKNGKAPWKDKNIPEYVKEKISNTLKERFENKENHPRYGTHLSEESREKISISLKEYYINNPNKIKRNDDGGDKNPSFTVYKIKNELTNEIIELGGRNSVEEYIMNYKKENNILPKRSPSHKKLLISENSYPFIFISKEKINKGKGKYCRKPN